VTYDIYFARPETGRTLLQTLEAANADFDLDAEPEPMRLPPGQRAAWDQIVQRVIRELGPASCEEFPYDLTLRREGPPGIVQLDYRGTSAAIYIPYRYPGHLALPVITEAYHIATLVEQETGLAGYDPQADRPAASENSPNSRSAGRRTRPAVCDTRGGDVTSHVRCPPAPRPGSSGPSPPDFPVVGELPGPAVSIPLLPEVCARTRGGRRAREARNRRAGLRSRTPIIRPRRS
jgi:hypothetical protein